MPSTTDQPPGARVPLLVQRLSYELTRFSHLFARHHALHPTDVEALAHLHQASLRGQVMTPSRLADAIDLSPPATSALLRRLEASGHVERVPDPADGRRHLLALTDTARQVASGFFGPLAGALRESLVDLDDAEVAVVERWLASAADGAGRLADRIADTDRPGPPHA